MEIAFPLSPLFSSWRRLTTLSLFLFLSSTVFDFATTLHHTRLTIHIGLLEQW